MKIRGNAQHVAEKYLQLARDAHTSGDPVAAENYLQHAEHYFRLIAAAQAAQALAMSGQQRSPGDGETGEFDDDDDFGAVSDRFASPSERVGSYQPQHGGFHGPPAAAPNAPQPYVERPQFEPDRSGQNERSGFSGRPGQGGRFGDRGPRTDRPFGERPDGYRDQNRDGRTREFRPYRDTPAQPREGELETGGSPSLPSFITGEPKSNSAEANNLSGSEANNLSGSGPGPIPTSGEAADASASDQNSSGESAFPSRGRRRRLRSPYGFNPSQPARDEAEVQNASSIGDETSATE